MNYRKAKKGEVACWECNYCVHDSFGTREAGFVNFLLCMENQTDVDEGNTCDRAERKGEDR